MSIITRINKAEKRIVDLYNKLKNLPSGGGGDVLSKYTSLINKEAFNYSGSNFF